MKKLNRLFFSLTIIWMAVIFIFSAQTGNTSSNMSGGITEFILNIIYKDFDNFPLSKQQELLETTNFIIRKGAHFTEFGILGLLSLLTILTRCYTEVNAITNKKWKTVAMKSSLYSLFFSALYATSDEIHQSFTANRNPSIIDVIIDSSGALCAIIFTLIIFYIFYIKKQLKKRIAGEYN